MNNRALKQIIAFILALLFLWVVNYFFSDDGSRNAPKKSTVSEKSVNASSAKSGETFTVTRVADGDTIYVRDASGQSNRIRFLGIDAPETKMAYGKQSQQALKKILDAAGKKVQIIYSERDIHNRIIGKVIADGKDVNLEMIKTAMPGISSVMPRMWILTTVSFTKRQKKKPEQRNWDCGLIRTPFLPGNGERPIHVKTNNV